MEEQKKEDQGTGSNKKQDIDLAGERPRRSMMLWCLAGVYLLYIGYSLCSNVIKGEEGASIGFFLAGAAFLVIGGGLLFFGVKGYLKSDKLRKEQETAAQTGMKESAPEKEAAETEEPKQKMSIAQRAALANRSDEDEEE